MARNMKHFTDLLLEDYSDKLVDQWIKLNIQPWRYNYLAQKWTCPKSLDNREILPEEQWEKENILLDALKKNDALAKETNQKISLYETEEKKERELAEKKEETDWETDPYIEE